MRGTALLPQQLHVRPQSKKLGYITNLIEVDSPATLTVDSHERLMNDFALFAKRLGAPGQWDRQDYAPRGLVGQLVEILHPLAVLIFQPIENLVPLLSGDCENEITTGEKLKRECGLTPPGRTEQRYLLTLLPIEPEGKEFLPGYFASTRRQTGEAVQGHAA